MAPVLAGWEPASAPRPPTMGITRRRRADRPTANPTHSAVAPKTAVEARDIEAIDGELRLLARAWRVARELCDRMPSTAHIDALLDERMK